MKYSNVKNSSKKIIKKLYQSRVVVEDIPDVQLAQQQEDAIQGQQQNLHMHLHLNHLHLVGLALE